MNYESFFKQSIDQLILNNNYREFLDISRICGKFPLAKNHRNNQEIVVWCSNDYLGLGQNEKAIDEVIKIIKQTGIGAGGTRNLSGNNHPIIELELEIAKLHNKESGLVFTSGYVANDATIAALAKIIPNLVIFSDEKNHASIIHGIKNSRLEKQIFRHNDMAHLEELLGQYEINHPKIIIFESVYSMHGDFSHMAKIIALAKKYNALTYIDEVHSVGLYGKNGAGLADEFGLADKIDIIQGTFGKAFGGIGGYITSTKLIIDSVRSYAPGFIFTTAIPPMAAAGIIANIRHLKSSDKENKDHKEKVAKLKNALQKNSIKIIPNNSHIVAVPIGEALLVKKISKILLEDYNIYIQHINFPTVPKGDEMLRIITTPLQTDQMINDLVEAMTAIFKKFNIN